jgi:hypothetical protein
MDGLDLYDIIRGDIPLDSDSRERYEFLHEPQFEPSMGRATNLIRGYVATFRLEPDGRMLLEEFRFPNASFRRWRQQQVGERLTGDFWLVLKPGFYGQSVFVPFRDGRVVEEKRSWVIQPYDGLRMRGPSLDPEGLEAYMAASRSKNEALEAELAAQEYRDPFSIPIAVLELWGSTFHPLARAGLETVGELCARTAEDLKRKIGLSENSINELREALADFDLKLRGD